MGRFWTKLVEIKCLKSKQLHVNISVSFINLRCILYFPLKLIGNLPKVLNLNWLFLKLNWPSGQMSLFIDADY